MECFLHTYSHSDLKLGSRSPMSPLYCQCPEKNNDHILYLRYGLSDRVIYLIFIIALRSNEPSILCGTFVS